ncbi:MAG TPA: extracellular solute-binding protein [Clostridiales bacterium]|nr:extracellular solute-binding protein [Clostridiales bacterium]
MKKKALALLLTAAMAVSLLTGCGSAADKQGTDTQEGTTAENTNTPEDNSGTTDGEDSGKELSGTLTIWSSGEELGRFVEGFNAIYPNIKVDITVVPNADFLAKLTPTLSSGQGAPDIFTGESDYVRYLVESPYWEDLKQEPYNVTQYTNDIWKYIVSVGTDSNGAIKALSWQASPGSIMYRRDMAQEYLGVSEPEDVAKLLGSNADMLKVAATLQENGIKMFASWQDIWNMSFSNRDSSWIENNTLMIGDDVLGFMDMAKEITDKGYSLNVDPWSPEWTAAVESTDTFCYVLPTWGYQFVVKPAADTTKGKWGLTTGPVPYVKGGTWLGIYKDSPNKELAWEFMKYVTCNSEAQKAYAQQYGEYVSSASADEALAAGEGEEVLGGQNLYEFYNSQMLQIPDNKMSPYDGVINNAFLSAAKAYTTGALSKDEAIQQFKDDVASSYPDLTIE